MTLRQRIQQGSGASLLKKDYGNVGDIYQRGPRIKPQRPEPLYYQAEPYIIQRLRTPAGRDASLHERLIDAGKFSDVPVFRTGLELPGTEGVMEVVPITHKERQVASIVASLKKLAENSASMFGGISKKLSEAINEKLSHRQSSKIDSLNKRSEQPFLEDMQKLVLSQKYKDKMNLNDVINRIGEDGVYTPFPEEGSDDLDAYLAGEAPPDEKEEPEPYEEPEEEKEEKEEKEAASVMALAQERGYGPPVDTIGGRNVYERDGNLYMFDPITAQFRQDVYRAAAIGRDMPAPPELERDDSVVVPRDEYDIGV